MPPTAAVRTSSCFLHLKDKKIGDSTISIYRFSEIPLSTKYTDIIERVAQDVLPPYNNLVTQGGTSNPTDVNFYLVGAFTDGSKTDRGQAVPFPVSTGQTCYIQILCSGPSSDEANTEMIFKHVLTYELYHCVESHGTHDNPTTTQNEIVKWWFEAGAENFANTMYLAQNLILMPGAIIRGIRCMSRSPGQPSSSNTSRTSGGLTRKSIIGLWTRNSPIARRKKLRGFRRIPGLMQHSNLR